MTDFFEYLENLEPKFRQKQLRQAVFKDLIVDAEALLTFPKEERAKIAESVALNPFKVEKFFNLGKSKKWLLKTTDGKYLETVLLQFKDGRNTVCVSSQIGCPMGCIFCATGKLGLTRNLSAFEIISQVLVAGKELAKKDRKVTNIVFMGMGEPLLNLENVGKAVFELTSEDGFGLGARHVAVSTCGVVNSLVKFIDLETRTRLVISLHAPNQALRERLMPIAKVNKLDELFRVLDYFVKKTNKRVSYEYVLIDGVNDSDANAMELANLLKNRLAHVNLIAFNEIEKSDFKPSPKERVMIFRSILEKAGVPTTIRISLGDEIEAACGQLAGKRIS
jgi:23S rRNA (adenine2503-C2)-methyltransferase